MVMRFLVRSLKEIESGIPALLPPSPPLLLSPTNRVDSIQNLFALKNAIDLCPHVRLRETLEPENRETKDRKDKRPRKNRHCSPFSSFIRHAQAAIVQIDDVFSFVDCSWIFVVNRFVVQYGNAGNCGFQGVLVKWIARTKSFLLLVFFAIITSLTKVKDKRMYNERRPFVREHEGNFHKFIICKLSLSCSRSTGQDERAQSDSGVSLKVTESCRILICWRVDTCQRPKLP